MLEVLNGFIVNSAECYNVCLYLPTDRKNSLLIKLAAMLDFHFEAYFLIFISREGVWSSYKSQLGVEMGILLCEVLVTTTYFSNPIFFSETFFCEPPPVIVKPLFFNFFSWGMQIVNDPSIIHPCTKGDNVVGWLWKLISLDWNYSTEWCDNYWLNYDKDAYVGCQEKSIIYELVCCAL